MINVMDYVKKPMNEAEKTLDSQLWHACAGGMVQMPPLNSKVLYFPQGHAEHAGTKNIDSSCSRRIPPYILCQVSAINFMADPDTDEVYSKIRLLPLRNQNNHNFQDDGDNNQLLGFDRKTNENKEKPSSFAKTLTQSDANNGGGFSVPRYCAETIFPRLDYAADPPVQTILVKDVHGQIWKFRHIYRGTPRRHLLTTGWSNFVNHKKLVAGDSIVFLRADNGELCVGIRRAKRGIGGGFFDIPNAYNVGCKASVESVIEAVNHAVNGEAFEVVYYPRASTPEFCVKASTVKSAMRIQWCPGMRFKMPFETEDSSRISWFMGTVSGVQVEDQIRWPNSPWRLLQVAWDEPELLQNVKRVNPWLVELVASMPAIHLSPFSPPRKKLRVPDYPMLTMPPSIQGARHISQFGLDPRLPFNPFPNGFTNHDALRRFPFQERHENVSCLLSIGNNNPKVELKKKNEETKKKPMFVLFGQPILTEQQLSESVSGDTDGDGSVVLQNDSVRSSSEEDGSWVKTGHCKVFLESEDMGRTLDLTALNSYEELYIYLATLFGLEKSEISSNLIYLNGTGAIKHTGDEPFSEFSKVARRLTILTDSASGNVGC
ncbi:PB1 domain, Auxin response factor, DNA-binding pseudobarrel domain protein [Artemisia annua]|uniref:Auxin response factor n=1 Tax=Artemisia annua TaxID=35608 RepID=A0A2U1PN78_ARTAN|nr:PB1 domain, Auxin response factor, DNA-binding pseudobarrel domain protein [Artemisia annua]